MSRLILALLLIAGLATIMGCSSDDDTVVTVPAPTGMAVDTLFIVKVTTPPTTLADPYWATADWLAITSMNQSTSLLYGDGQMNMSGTFDGITEFNGGTDPDLRMKAAYDNTNIYIYTEWTDSDFNLDRRRWLYDGPADPRKPGEATAGWTSQLNDDKIGLAFEISSASSAFGTFANVGCAAACHDAGGGIDMRPQAGVVDIWHWKTSRSEPLGYVNDQQSDPTNGRASDAGTSIENRNRIGATNRSGPEFEWDGTTQTVMKSDGSMVTLDPAYILFNKMNFMGDAAAGDVVYQGSCAGCHGNNGQGASAAALNTPNWTRVSRADLDTNVSDAGHPGSGAYNGLNATQKTDLVARLRSLSGVPGYYLAQPTGSQADVKTVSNVSYTMVDNVMHAKYQLIMYRALDTGNSDDAAFDPVNNPILPFGVGLMDNDGRNHIGSRIEALRFKP